MNTYFKILLLFVWTLVIVLLLGLVLIELDKDESRLADIIRFIGSISLYATIIMGIFYGYWFILTI